MIFSLLTAQETSETLAKRLKELRLVKKWKRSTLSERSGVTVSSLIRFEQTGHVSLDNFLKLLSALDRLNEMENLLLPPKARSIDDLVKSDETIARRGSV